MDLFSCKGSFLAAATAAAILAIAGCGGSGGGDAVPPPPASPPPANPAVVDLRGQVARSIQLVEGEIETGDVVRLYDTTGAVRSTTLGADDRFTFSDVGALKAPLLLTIESAGALTVIKTMPTANTNVYLSFSGNAVAASAVGKTTGEVEAAPALAAVQLTAANVEAALGRLRTTLGPVVSALGADPATFDPALSAQTLALESILHFDGNNAGDMTFLNGNAQLPSDRGLSWVTIGTALPPPVFADSGLVKPLLAALTKCFKLPVADRAAVDAAGDITALKGACATMPVASDYSNSLSTFTERYSPWLLDPKSLNASFGAAMSGATSSDQAVLKIGMVRSDGFEDFRFDTISRAAAGSTMWQLRGNQRAYAIFTGADYYRVIHQNPPPPNPTTHFGFSRVQSGLEFRFDPTVGTAGANVRAIRIKGRGLPAAGLVLTRSTSCNRASRFVIANRTGDASVATSGNRSSTFVLQATAVQSGGPLGPWPGASVDHANAPLTPAQFAEFGDLEPYQVEVFKTTDTTTPSETFTMRTGERPRESGFARDFAGWAQLPQATLEYLNPAHPKAAAAARISMAWTVPAPAAGRAPNAEPSNVYVATRGMVGAMANTRVNDSIVFVPGINNSADFASNRPPAGETIPCTAANFPALTTNVNDFRLFGAFLNWNSNRYSTEYFWQSF